MCAQKSILSFFKPNSVAKRNPLMDLQNSPNKKFKSCASDSVSNKNEIFEDSNDNSVNNSNEVNNSARESNESKSGILTGDTASATLSPNDKKQIENKRLQAKLKILSKTLPVVDPNMSLSWFAALEKEFGKPYFKELNNFVTAERQRKTIYPPENQIWTWTKLCELEDIKVVILGQDPYHNPGQAHGLCFSVPVGVQLPPSLMNMYKELANNYEGFEAPKHGYLVGWAKQGILLLNAVLTVEARKPNSHKDRGWEKLTTAVIKYLSDNYKGIVFLLWGAYAQKKAEVVDGKKHHILKAGHPSPLSASRGFFGCKHFIKCNELLEKQGKSPIKWDWLPKSE